MTSAHVDYRAVLAAADVDARPGVLGEVLLAEFGSAYRAEHGDVFLQVFPQGSATFLFDLASAGGLDREDRTVAAWAVTPDEVPTRDVGYQRGYPMQSGDGPPVDRGHLVPNLSGGEFGPNLFRQDRALNRGWSEAGKRYRAPEREAAVPGAFFFGRLLYSDETAYPAEVEIGLLRHAVLHAERFDNRPEPGQGTRQREPRG